MFWRKMTPSRLETYASPLMVVGAAVILIIVVAVLAVYNVNREAKFTSRMLVEKGVLLIRAFEAGTRVGMIRRFSLQTEMQNLAEQIAVMPGVRYIALVDGSGKVLAHSDSQRLDQEFAGAMELEKKPSDSSLKWGVVMDNDEQIFIVYRAFNPFVPSPEEAGPHFDFPPPPPPPGCSPGSTDKNCPPPPPFLPHEMRGQHMHGMGMGMRGRRNESQKERLKRRQAMMAEAWRQWRKSLLDKKDKDINPEKLTIFIGLDATAFEDARRQDVRVTLLLAATLLALGLGGVVALYWAQRLRASRKLLRDTRAFASEVVTHMPIGCVTTDMQGRITMVNRTAEVLLGSRSRLKEGEPYDQEGNIPGPLIEPLKRLLEGEEMVENLVECRLDTEPGSDDEETVLPLNVSGVRLSTEPSGEGETEYVGTMLLFRDLREVRSLENAVRRAEKLAAVGNLAAGVAHEIRNPLSSIKASATFFGAQFQEGSDSKRMAGIMVQEVDRLNRAVTQLLEYARPSDITPRPTPLAPLAQRSLDLIKRDAKAHEVEVVLEARDAPEIVNMDPDRITQVLLNLCINAIQAMKSGGRLTVRLESTTVNRRPMARITVKDTGPGLPIEDVERVFDPYFTTKARGTGLGLAIVQKIVESHKGEVRVQSTQGQGAIFTVLLPLQ